MGSIARVLGRFSPDEIAIIREFFATETNGQIAKRLNRSRKSILSKTLQLGLSRRDEPSAVLDSDLGIGFIKLCGGMAKGQAAIVDADMLEELSKYRWNYSPYGYATRGSSREERKNGFPNSIPMHRQIMGYPEIFKLDHINRVTLDNRKENLRLCTTAENIWNTVAVGGSSQFKGVSRRNYGRWAAEICIKKNRVYLGTFSLESEAARAYDSAALFYQGEFARPNFPDSIPLSFEEIKKLNR